jgi:predicted aspartyl protease
MVTAPVSDLRTTATTDVTFVVDTGADLTVLHQDVADAVNL